MTKKLHHSIANWQLALSTKLTQTPQQNEYLCILFDMDTCVL